jgi:aminoglycoside phosphotransferase (APT) family kinase protein
VDGKDIARRFGLGRSVRLSEGPVARGKQGVVWRLDTSDGSWAVKVPFERPSEEEVRMATQFQEWAYLTGVPTPQVRRTTEGDVFGRCGESEVRVYEWVDLLPRDLGLAPALVGAVVAAMHHVPATDLGPWDPWYVEPVGADRWDELVGQVAEAGAPFAVRLAELRDELVALESWIEPSQASRVCHRDLWADNVLPTADGGVCVIDWENSGPADPSQELGCVLFEFGRSDPGRARALVDAYASAGGPASVSRRGHFSMLIAQLGHVTEAAACDWLEPNARSPQRADSEAWIGEVLDEPHTRDLLDGLLAASRG